MKSNLILSSVFALVISVGCASKKNQPKGDNNFTEFSHSPNRTAIGLKPTTLTNTLSPEMLHPADALFTLGPGDALDIEIPGIATSRADTTIGPDGKVYYSLLPGLDVWGLTLQQARELMEKELGKYMTQPQITLTLRTVGSRYVWLLGRLNRPGIFPLAGPMTLLEVIALAGGTSRSASQASTAELADLRHSFVVRQGQLLPVDFDRLLRKGDLSQNIALQPDDFIYIPSTLSQEVYVLGAVLAPHAVPYSEPTTLVSAISGANGPAKYDIPLGVDNGPFTRDAYLSHIAIVRGTVSEPQIAVVDYGAIVKGRAPDVVLEAGDIVFVPNSPYTNLKRYFNTIMNTFVTTVAANEGIRAGGGNVSVGVSVPVGQSSSATAPAVSR